MLLTIPSITRGIPATVTLNKTDLFALSEVAADPFFQNPVKTEKVFCVFVSEPGNQKEILSFSMSQATPQARFLVSLEARSVFRLTRIILQDRDGGQLIISRNAVLEQFDVTLAVDSDGDGVFDSEDNAPSDANPDQLDTDADGVGDVADADDDGDGLSDAEESSGGTDPLLADTDGDGLGDGDDNAPLDYNPDQADTDMDDIADVLDSDDDGDGLSDEEEVSEGTDPLLADTDGDGVGDSTDNAPLNSNPDQADVDGDGIPDVIDPTDDTDTDGDGVIDSEDNAPNDANPDQLDTDADGVGDAADLDDDADGLSDADEAAAGTDPLLADTDGDGVGDATDNAPLDENADQADTDSDGTPDVLDLDDDGDGLSDSGEVAAGTNSLDPDTDGDGVSDGDEVAAGTDPLNPPSAESIHMIGRATTSGGTVESSNAAYYIDSTLQSLNLTGISAAGLSNSRFMTGIAVDDGSQGNGVVYANIISQKDFWRNSQFGSERIGATLTGLDRYSSVAVVPSENHLESKSVYVSGQKNSQPAIWKYNHQTEALDVTVYPVTGGSGLVVALYGNDSGLSAAVTSEALTEDENGITSVVSLEIKDVLAGTSAVVLSGQRGNGVDYGIFQPRLSRSPNGQYVYFAALVSEDGVASRVFKNNLGNTVNLEGAILGIATSDTHWYALEEVLDGSGAFLVVSGAHGSQSGVVLYPIAAPAGYSGIFTRGMDFHNGSIYVYGRVMAGSVFTPCVWRDGVPTVYPVALSLNAADVA